ncbi:MAG: 3-isopropylmalate dehydratase small subunit [Actinobacteria bacterium]|nr:3-isopropylmalate dehydratase small subunit [Actinomycetota bacterium]
MEPFETVTGATAPLDRANVDTDQIMPKEFLKRIERTGFGQFVFHNWREEEDDFVLERPEFRDAPILVTGPNFGSGSSREHAPWGLQDWGYKVVIAPSFADIFRSNCGKIGLLTVALPEADVRELLDAAPAAITVSLEDRTVTMPDGRVVAFAFDDKVRENLLNGWDDIALTLLREDRIAEYEATRERQGPSTLSLG